MHAVMDERWRGWIRENIARGCARDQLLQILLGNGFDPSVSRQALDQVALPQTRIHTVPGVVAYHPNRIELYALDDFLPEALCDRLVTLIADNLRPSTITTQDVEPDPYFRTSRTCDLDHLHDPAIDETNARICEALGIARPYGEPLQAQVYEEGEEFKAHTDYFEPATPEFERYASARGQRTWTFMVYLRTPQAGGATRFLRFGRDFEARRGRAVAWNNLYADGQPNPDTLHHGMPVEAGTKVIITKWFRMMPEP